MSNSKKKKVADRLYELKDDIDTMQTIPEFHGWLTEILDVADNYIKSRNPYNKLLELNEHVKLDASIIDSHILQPNLRSKAAELIKSLISIIEREGLYVEKSGNPSFDALEFVRKYSLTGTLVVGIFYLGYNHFRNENDIEMQRQKAERLEEQNLELKKTNILILSKLDSIAKLR